MAILLQKNSRKQNYRRRCIIPTFFLLSDKGETVILIVEIISEKRTKPFLGGFRVMPDDIEYHHAGMQTEKVRKRSWS